MVTTNLENLAQEKIDLNDLLGQIEEQFKLFKTDAEKNILSNKAAGVRARKYSLAIEKLMKQYRLDSIEADR